MSTKTQRQTRMTCQEVQEIITQLQEQGFDNPSVRQIYQALGRRGSFTKILELKKQVLAHTVTYNDNGVINSDNTLSNSRVIHLDNMLANDLSNRANDNVVNLDNTLAYIETLLWERIQPKIDEWCSKHELIQR